MGSPWLRILVLAPMLAANLLSQELDTALHREEASLRRSIIIDQVADPKERRAFLQLHEARGPQKRRALANAFLDQYPQSWLLSEVLEILSKACIDLGDYDDAIRFGTAVAPSAVARHLRERDPEKARQYQARFVGLQQKRRITERADTLGNFALASAAARDWNQAVAQLQEAVQIRGNCQSKGNLHKDLGFTYCRSGDLVKGERELRIAQSVKPNDPDVKKSLQMIAELRSGGAQTQPVH